MQLQQLAYFVAVAEARNFTRAAEGLHVTQPTLSQQVRALERSLGSALFTRRPGNVELTAAGEELLPVARRMLADAAHARRALRELDGLHRGQVRVGATPSLCTGLMPTIVRAFHDAHPAVAISLAESGSRDLQEGLAAGGLDLALLVDSRAHDDPRLHTDPLFVEDLVVVSAADGATPVDRGPMPIEDLRTQPMIMFRPGYDLRETTLAACRDRGFTPTFVVEGGEMDAVLGFVAAGIGIAVVPETVAGPRFRTTPLAAPGLTRTIQLARRRDVELSPAARAFERVVLDHTPAGR